MNGRTIENLRKSSERDKADNVEQWADKPQYVKERTEMTARQRWVAQNGTDKQKAEVWDNHANRLDKQIEKSKSRQRKPIEDKQLEEFRQKELDPDKRGKTVAGSIGTKRFEKDAERTTRHATKGTAGTKQHDSTRTYQRQNRYVGTTRSKDK